MDEDNALQLVLPSALPSPSSSTEPVDPLLLRAGRHVVARMKRTTRSINWPVFVVYCGCLVVLFHALSGQGYDPSDYPEDLMLQSDDASPPPFPPEQTGDLSAQRWAKDVWLKLKADMREEIVRGREEWAGLGKAKGRFGAQRWMAYRGGVGEERVDEDDGEEVDKDLGDLESQTGDESFLGRSPVPQDSADSPVPDKAAAFPARAPADDSSGDSDPDAQLDGYAELSSFEGASDLAQTMTHDHAMIVYATPTT